MKGLTNCSAKYKYKKNIAKLFKGTFRPDWIFMRVVPLDRHKKGHQPLCGTSLTSYLPVSMYPL